jgi:hypothetical protein
MCVGVWWRFGRAGTQQGVWLEWRMGSKAREIVAFIREPAAIEITAGVVHLRERSGGIQIDRAMSIATFKRHCKMCDDAIKRYANGEQNVVVE